MSDELRAKVEAAAANLGYRVRQPAYASDADVPAVIVLHTKLPGPWVRLAEAVAHVLEAGGLQAVRVGATDPSSVFGHWIGVTRIGLLGMPVPTSLLARVAAGDLRLAMVGDDLPAVAGVHGIRYSAQCGLAMALAGLRGLGHRRIGRMGGRRSGGGDSDHRDATDMLRAVGAEDAATALICDDAATAAWTVLEAQRLGIQIPEQLSILALSDHPLLLGLTPPVTALSEPIEAMAHALCGALTGEGSPTRKSAFKPRIAVRASTAALLNRST